MAKTLSKFIEKIGVAEASIVLDAPIRTVTSWRRRDRFPSPKKGTEIVKKTKRHKHGPVTFQGIYEIK